MVVDEAIRADPNRSILRVHARTAGVVYELTLGARTRRSSTRSPRAETAPTAKQKRSELELAASNPRETAIPDKATETRHPSRSALVSCHIATAATPNKSNSDMPRETTNPPDTALISPGTEPPPTATSSHARAAPIGPSSAKRRRESSICRKTVPTERHRRKTDHAPRTKRQVVHTLRGSSVRARRLAPQDEIWA